MRLVLHPKVYSDIAQVMEYYEQVASADLAEEFYAELQQLTHEAAKRPESFPIRERDIRRANLRRFPYHFLFRMTSDAVRTPPQKRTVFRNRTQMNSLRLMTRTVWSTAGSRAHLQHVRQLDGLVRWRGRQRFYARRGQGHRRLRQLINTFNESARSQARPAVDHH